MRANTFDTDIDLNTQIALLKTKDRIRELENQLIWYRNLAVQTVHKLEEINTVTTSLLTLTEENTVSRADIILDLEALEGRN